LWDTCIFFFFGISKILFIYSMMFCGTTDGKHCTTQTRDIAMIT